MFYSEKTARKMVVDASKKLLHAGLVARTWGNISARISQHQFVITPSGLSYEFMRPEDLVIVNTDDGSFEGKRKPSSEKGIHAAAYLLRPDAGFIIHTHQDAASVYGVSGRSMYGIRSAHLGPVIPCARYGMPSTKSLKNAVSDALRKYPLAKAVFMRNHGALCIGTDCEDAFLTASELEQVCRIKIAALAEPLFSPLPSPEDFGRSVKRGNRFCIKRNGKKRIYRLNHLPEDLPVAVKIHAEIYRHTDAQYVLWNSCDSVRRISLYGKTLHPYLEDLIQIAGTTIRCAAYADSSEIVKKLKGRNAVMIRGKGVLCTGKTKDDVTAVGILMDKGCRAALFAEKIPGCHPVNRADGLIQRIVYVKKYSRKKEEYV